MKSILYCCLSLAIPGLGASAQNTPIATGKPKWFGSIHSTSQVVNFTAYWNQVTPENAGKWGSVEATRDVMNWGQLDAAYALAKDNGFPFRFHILIWGNQQPAWIESLLPAEQLAEIKEWFAAVAARYTDIDYLEVVNEPISDPPDGPGDGAYIGALGGAGATGWDWVINAFMLARLHFPDTTLVLNEYGIESSTSKMAQYIGIIDLLKARGLIDMVAMQAHAFSTTVSAQTLSQNLATLAATGLPIQITELDVDGPSDAVQLANYQKIIPVYWEHPSIIGITLWGYRPGLWRNDQAAFIALDNGAERPALQWLRTYIAASDPDLLTRMTSHPADRIGVAGGTVQFTVTASGNPVPSLQWQRSTNGGADWTGLVDDATFSGATSAALTITGVTIGMGGDRFRTVASNIGGAPVTSASAVLAVTSQAPAGPVSTTAGNATTLSLPTEPGPDGALQWQMQPGGTGAWIDIPGATADTYEIPSTQRFHQGNYRLVVSVNDTTFTSDPITVGVQAAGAANAQVLNLSTRALAQTGDSVLIPGFVIDGTGTVKLLIRVAGATLGEDPFFLQGVLANPRMVLKRLTSNGNEDIASNDDWRGNANVVEIEQTTAALGAFELTNDNDAALLVNLAPGAYSVVTDGADGGSGKAIVELYNASPEPTTARLVNISNRGFAGSGDEVMIPGFVVSGDGPRTFLLRVVGPTLAGDPYFVTGTMADPAMTVYRSNPDGSNTVLFTQNDWGDNPDAPYTAQIAEQVGAIALNDSSADAAMVVTLAPGAYTVHGASADGTGTGVVLVELYVVQ